MGARHAEPQWRLGRLRRRQRTLRAEQHPVCRPRRAARSTDRRCHRPLPRHAGADSAMAVPAVLSARLAAGAAGAGRLVVRPLGTSTSTGPGRCCAGSTPSARTCRRPTSAGGGVPRRGSAEDGSWGEDCASYWPDRRLEVKTSTPSQTSWALLGLMAAAALDCPEVRRGVEHLLAAPRTRAMARGALQRGRLPPRLLSQVPRLQRLLPVVGTGPLPQSRPQQPQGAAGTLARAARRRQRPRREGACLQVLPADPRRSRCCWRPRGGRGSVARAGRRGCTALLSFGLAGGLDPRLRPRTSFSRKRSSMARAGDRWSAATGIASSAIAYGRPACRSPRRRSGQRPAADEAADKQAAAVRHAASAVDMESHVVARVAMRASLPFLVVRSIADPPTRRCRVGLPG